MACIYKRGKTWSYSVDIGYDQHGRRQKKGKGGFRTQKEAKEAAAIVEAEIARGIYVNEQSVTFKEFADIWLEEYKRKAKTNSITSRKNLLPHLKPFFNIKLKDITRVQYQKFIHEISAKLSRNTINNIHAIASMVFKLALKYEVVSKNPTTLIDLPKAKTSDLPKYMEKDQLQLFLETAKTFTPQTYTIFLLLAYTGLRRAELSALTWDDIDFVNKTLTVNKSLTCVKGGCLLEEPKTKKSKRTMPLSDIVIDELRKHKAGQKLASLEKFVFLKKNGKTISPGSIYYAMGKVTQAANLPLLPPHSLRHTHTSLLATAGVPLEAIAERLGHSDLKMIMQIYLHVTKDAKRDAVDKFDQYMAR